ncbi:hypothetical protein [Emticicia sp. TH156]|uniref:hypothetical protein n=1 Tax=Emticicia sp. TH156 TaxID=2067454 RepID=UPI000C78777D|nr:hypothetical protein [Emticicia sp. TH156]PLK42136.1 hypothetical protein C0V77_22390 [Emticicia sp. TH156]
MIEGEKYIEDVKAYFNYLITEFGFRILNIKIRGNAFYDLQYSDSNRIVSISYENIENYLQVIIFTLKNGELPDYDDKSKTLHLNRLNAQVKSSIDRDEIGLNNEYFVKFNPKTEIEKQLLKSAKELRLCLKHFNDMQ